MRTETRKFCIEFSRVEKIQFVEKKEKVENLVNLFFSFMKVIFTCKWSASRLESL